MEVAGIAIDKMEGWIWNKCIIHPYSIYDVLVYTHVKLLQE